MREIKFRGQYTQGIENAGCWVYWGLAGTDVLDCIDHDTIGQYTGLTDKNGKEIYEGDIVADYNCMPTPPDSAVTWNKEDARFQFEDWGIDMDDSESCEVIGNIHENPDLLDSAS